MSELKDFLLKTQSQIDTEIGERMSDPESPYPYPGPVFAEIVMQHMVEIGMTFDEPVSCHFERKVGNTNLKLSGYAISEEGDQLDLFVSLYEGVSDLKNASETDIRTAVEQCVRFLEKTVKGTLTRQLDESDDAYMFALTVETSYSQIEQIRIYLLTDLVCKNKILKPREVNGKTIKVEVMDIERLYRHLSEGKARDEVVINLIETCGAPLPCVYVPSQESDYSYALTAFPGETLRFIYDKYGARLLEANVRSFLSVTGKVNKGIRDTLRKNPEHFMAYNNGIVIVADDITLHPAADGSPGISSIKGMQIVNGGQTTASLYFTKKKNPETDLGKVRVATKIIVLNEADLNTEEELISNISRYSNSQNAVKEADLSANSPFHVLIEQFSNSTYCPDGVNRWFYERAAGSYKVMLDREGTTPSKLKLLKESIPPARKLTKTDLAKFLAIWAQKPHIVSRGAQKNFQAFMDDLRVDEEVKSDQRIAPHAKTYIYPELLDINVDTYKRTIAKAIIFKSAQTIIRRQFPAFQANILIYTLSLFAEIAGNRVNFDYIWNRQSISQAMLIQIQTWSYEVSKVLHETSNGRMISEWAKKDECWLKVKQASYSPIMAEIPELN